MAQYPRQASPPDFLSVSLLRQESDESVYGLNWGNIPEDILKNSSEFETLQQAREPSTWGALRI